MTVTPNKPQMKAGTARGRAPGVMYRLTPAAHQAQGRAHMRFAGSCRIDLPLTLPRNTGRGFGLGIFSAEGRGCRPSLAKISHSQASGAVQGFSELPEFHSSKSLPSSSTYASKTSQKRGQDHGNLSQGRGNLS